MTKRKLIPRFSRKAYRFMRGLVWLICGLLTITLGVAVYLNLIGIPGPILRRMVQRINETGVPIDVESVHLSFHGWKASHLRFYSTHPDDLEPVFYAAEAYLRKATLDDGTNVPFPGYNLKANGIRVSPSVQWCMGLPDDCFLRQVEHISMLLGHTSDAVVVQNGLIQWGDVVFHVAGTFHYEALKGAMPEPAPLMGALPIRIEPELYSQFEQTLNALEFSKNTTVELDFDLDFENPSSNRVAFAAETGAFTFRDVSFSRANVEASFEQNRICLSHASLFKDNGQIGIKGGYDLNKGEIQGWVSNEIASKQLFLLLPQPILQFFVQQELHAASFPVFDLKFGPSQPSNLLRKVDGSFAWHEVSFHRLEINKLAGKVNRTGDRMDVFNVQGEVVGQEHRAEKVGSCLKGGLGSGSCYWDAALHEFGVTAEVEFDPNLLIGPLSQVHAATNVISLFRFDGPVPLGHVELGACYDDWNSFFISIQGSGEQVRFNQVPFSSLSASAYYMDESLNLDRLIAKQGIDYVKGTASLDFRNGLVAFDGMCSINPRTLEDVIYPKHGIFSKSINVPGAAKVTGRGTVDWRKMESTSFSADVEVERMELPMIALDNLKVAVSGKGTVVEFQNAEFNVYGGTGSGMFSLCLDPSKTNIPYKVDVKIRRASFEEGLSYLFPDGSRKGSGDLSGFLQAEADFSRGFFGSANGKGHVNIRNGQLAELPLFRGFSGVMRMVFPSFRMFSINQLTGNFELKDGSVLSDDAYFDGRLISAKGRGSYSVQNGFDAHVQVQMLSDNEVSKIFRFFTDPLLKLFEVSLTGTLENPEWKAAPFSSE